MTLLNAADALSHSMLLYFYLRLDPCRMIRCVHSYYTLLLDLSANVYLRPMPYNPPGSQRWSVPGPRVRSAIRSSPLRLGEVSKRQSRASPRRVPQNLDAINGNDVRKPRSRGISLDSDHQGTMWGVGLDSCPPSPLYKSLKNHTHTTHLVASTTHCLQFKRWT